MRQLCGCFDFFLCSIFPAIADIIANRVLKQINVLKYHGNLFHQLFRVYGCFIYTAKDYFSLLRVIKSGNQPQHRTFSTPGRADNGCHRSRGESCAYIMQNHIFSITKIYMRKLNVMPLRSIPITSHNRLVQQINNPFTGCRLIDKDRKLDDGPNQWVKNAGSNQQKQNKYNNVQRTAHKQINAYHRY